MSIIKSRLLLILPVGICLLTSTALARKHGDASKDEVEVQNALANFIDAFSNLEWERFRQCFADDATVFNPAIPEVTELHRLDGREKIEAVFKAVFDRAKKGKGPPYLDIRPEEIKIQMLTNAAIVSFHFKRAGASFGRRTLILEKRRGKWLIVHLHASNVA